MVSKRQWLCESLEPRVYNHNMYLHTYYRYTYATKRKLTTEFNQSCIFLLSNDEKLSPIAELSHSPVIVVGFRDRLRGRTIAAPRGTNNMRVNDIIFGRREKIRKSDNSAYRFLSKQISVRTESASVGIEHLPSRNVFFCAKFNRLK